MPDDKDKREEAGKPAGQKPELEAGDKRSESDPESFADRADALEARIKVLEEALSREQVLRGEGDLNHLRDSFENRISQKADIIDTIADIKAELIRLKDTIAGSEESFLRYLRALDTLYKQLTGQEDAEIKSWLTELRTRLEQEQWDREKAKKEYLESGEVRPPSISIPASTAEPVFSPATKPSTEGPRPTTTEEPTPPAEPVAPEEPNLSEVEKPESAKPQRVDLESVKKELGFIDIDSREIMDNISAEDLATLQNLTAKYYEADKGFQEAEKVLSRSKKDKKKKAIKSTLDELAEKDEEQSRAEEEARLQEIMAKVQEAKANLINFYTGKIKEILRTKNREADFTESQVCNAAEAINLIVQRTIEFEVNSELSSLTKQKGAIVKSVGRTLLVGAGTTAAMIYLAPYLTVLGTSLGAASLVGASSGMAINRLLRAGQKGLEVIGSGSRASQREEKINQEKDKILAKFFRSEDKLREYLGATLSNILRKETSGKALESLSAHSAEKNRASDPGFKPESLDNFTQELYRAAYNMLRANDQYSQIPSSQLRETALTLAITLARHETNDSLAQANVDTLQKNKPGVFRLIENYNYVQGGFKGAEADRGDSFMARHKHDFWSAGIGIAMGTALREVGPLRVISGAFAGGAIGKKVGEWSEQADRAKVYQELEKMLEESEKMIKDTDIPSNQWEQVKQNAHIVKSRLRLGILKANPLLTNRAENFLHNVQNLEISRSKSKVQPVLDSVIENRKSLEKQMSKDVERLVQKYRKKKILIMVGAAVGGVSALIIPKLFGPDDDKSGTKIDDSAAAASKSTNPETYPAATEKFPLTADPDKLAAEKTVDTHPKMVPAMEKSGAADGRLEDVIDSSKVSGSDSIWKSTRNIIEHNADKFGYKGDITNQAALAKWAETQTANLVAELNKEQGGNLADLVHGGDKVVIDFKDGQPHLSFEAASGIPAGHLSDTNVEKILADTKFAEGVEHTSHINSRSGDQYMEIKGREGVYKVYDWDRDSRPDVVMPDGRQLEMSQQELDSFLVDKNMTASPVSETLPALPPDSAEQQQARLTQFMNEKGLYQEGLYETAKSQNKTDDLFRTVLQTKNEKNLSFFVDDYAKDHGFSTDKRDIFYHQLRNTDKIYEYQGPVEHLVKSFEEDVIDNFKSAQDHVAKKWYPIRLGDQGPYALVQKFHTGIMPFRSDHYFVDTNGDGRSEFIIDNDQDLAVAFKKGHFEVKTENAFGPVVEEQLHSHEDSLHSHEEHKQHHIEYVANKGETTPQSSPEELSKEDLVDDSTPKIVDTSDQVLEAEAKTATNSATAELVKNVTMEKNLMDMEPRLLAVESINRGDPSLHFDLNKIETGDEPYLTKVREDVQGMLAFLRNSSGGNVPKLYQGYSEVLILIDKKLAK